MYVILIFFYAVTIVGLYQICCLLFGKNAFTAVQGMILSTYLPYAFLVNNILWRSYRIRICRSSCLDGVSLPTIRKDALFFILRHQYGPGRNI